MKKIYAVLLIFSILITMFIQPKIVWANSQSQVVKFQVDQVSHILGQDYASGKTILRPKIKLSWEDPDEWEEGVDEDDRHPPEKYEITVKNITLNKTNTFFVDAAEHSVQVEDHMNLDTGSFYEFTIKPIHYHSTIVNEEVVKQLAPSIGTPLKCYAITDLNVTLTSEQDKIDVIWDKIGIDDMYYKITYSAGDYSDMTSEEFKNKDVTVKDGIKAGEGEVEEFYDSSTKRNKLKYTIDQNIYPGQIYSFIVEPTISVEGGSTDYYNGQQVIKNYNNLNVFTGSTNVALNVIEDGNYVRLSWNIPISFQVGQDSTSYSLVEATILQYVDGQSKNIVVFNKGEAATTSYYRISKPEGEVAYQIQLKYDDDGTKDPIIAESDKVSYVPESLKLTPTQPQIPKPISESTINYLKTLPEGDLKQVIEDEYLLKGDTYNNNLNSLLSSSKVFTVDDSNKIQIVFSPFVHKNFDSESDENIVDTNVDYDIYVAKSLEDLSSALKVVDQQSFNSTDTESVIKDSTDEIIGYKVLLDQYYDADKLGLQTIVPNQLYYIKVVATKNIGDTQLKSEPSIVSIYFDYDGNIYIPPTISKPPLKEREEDAKPDSVTFEWYEKWYEIMAKDTVAFPELSSFTSEVWVDSQGDISTTKIDSGTYYKIFEGESEAQRLKQDVTNFDYILNEVNLGTDPFGLSDVKYKFYKMPYDEVKDTIDSKVDYTLNDYILELIEKDKNGTEPVDWEEITPTKDTNDTNILSYTVDALLPNTQYLFLLYPYRVDLNGDSLYTHFPTPLVVVTNSEDRETNPDPTVPSLYVTDYTDISAEVSFRYNKDFEYEIKYGVVDDVTKAETLNVTFPTDENDPLYPIDGELYKYTIKDLFPSSQYYVWIRAIQSETNKSSAYSNPVIITTKDIIAPEPPRGIGLASLDSLTPQGYTQSKTENYLTLEWLLDEEDNPSAYTDANIKKTFNYIVEVADNPNFIEPTYIELSDESGETIPTNVEKLKKNVIKINELTANRKYYFRLKTKVIITGKNDNQTLSKTSTYYSSTIALITLVSDTEYDGGNNTNVIVPYEDYEIDYDDTKNEVYYRFKNEGYDKDGNSDEFVAENLISNLIKEKRYEYIVDVSQYKYKPIAKTKVEIPYRVWSAFDEHNVKLVIKANESNITLPAYSLQNHIKQQTGNYATNPTVLISIDELSNYTTKGGLTTSNSSSVTTPQKFNIALLTDKGKKEINYTDKPITIQLNVRNRSSVYDKPVQVYRYDDTLAKYIETPSSYDNNQGVLSTTINTLGVYYSYVSNVASSNAHWAVTYKNDVHSKINLQNLNIVNLNEKASKDKFLSIIYGLIDGKKSIDVSEVLNSNQKDHLKKANILISDKTTLLRQEALHIAVMALMQMQGQYYSSEAKTVQQVDQYNNVDKSYIDTVALAVDLGFASDVKNIRPTDTLTYGEMYAVLSRVLDLR